MTRTSAGLVPVLILALAALASAENAARPRITVEPVNPWTHLDLRNDPDHFQFAIVTDRTGGHREGVFADAMGKLNLLQPEFVMSVGDLIEGYTEDRETLDAEWDEFDGFVDALDMPFFYLAGNHDISNEVMAEVWAERFGRAYYSFVYRDVLFVGLNSEDGEPGNVGPGQRDWLAGVLGEHRDVRWTLVFVHKPLWNYVDGGELRDTGWAEVEELLRGRRHTVFAGHFHRYTKHVRNDSRYFVLATTGGGSSLAGPLYGQFDHVVWVTMTDDGPRIANLMLDGIWDEDIRTEEMARLVGPLISGGAVVVEPILGRSKRFAGGVTSVRLTNDADVPLRISARFAEHAVLAPSPAAIDLELPPNSVERIDLEISTESERAVDELSPLQLQWQAEYVQDELEIPAVDGSAPMVVSRIYELPRRTAAPVVVDGDLSDWDRLAFHVPEPAEIDVDADSWTGPATAPGASASSTTTTTSTWPWRSPTSAASTSAPTPGPRTGWSCASTAVPTRSAPAGATPAAPWRSASSSPSAPASGWRRWSWWCRRSWTPSGCRPSASPPPRATPTRSPSPSAISSTARARTGAGCGSTSPWTTSTRRPAPWPSCGGSPTGAMRRTSPAPGPSSASREGAGLRGRPRPSGSPAPAEPRDRALSGSPGTSSAPASGSPASPGPGRGAGPGIRPACCQGGGPRKGRREAG